MNWKILAGGGVGGFSVIIMQVSVQTGTELAKRMLKLVFCQTLDLDLGLKMLIILELNVVLTPNQAVNSSVSVV